MSRGVDNRVVSLELENSKFEKNAKTSIKTLNELDNALAFKNGAKSFQDVEEAAKRTNFKSLISAADTVTDRLSAMGIMGARALERITDKAIDTGKKLVSSLSIDQVASGFSKYEQKTASVQTLMNSTGKSIDEIEGYLDRLMWFSDETSYGFTDMTSALATMVSSGGDIEKLIPMMEGVANATAFAGKGAAEFSRVIYNLQQSYSGGFLTLGDWKSIQFAGANSKQLVETLIQAGEELGTIQEKVGDVGSVTVENFANTLSKQWATKEVMEAAFGYFDEMTQKAKEMVDAGVVDTATEAYRILSEEYDTVSMRAAKAAQEAKSFSEAIDATKDAVSSGWMRSFETIFGDKEQATKLWSDFSESLWTIFASGAEDRNTLLQSSLQPLKAMKTAVIAAGGSVADLDALLVKTTEAISAPANRLKELGKDTYLFMGKEGEEVKILQESLVSLGKLSEDAVTGVFDKKTYQAVMSYQRDMGETITGFVKSGTIENMIQSIGEVETAVSSVAETTEDGTVNAAETAAKIESVLSELPPTIAEMSDEQIKNTGYTKEQISAMLGMSRAAEKAGMSLEEFIDFAYNKKSGRDNLIEGFWNVWEGFFGNGDDYLGVLGALKEAWAEVFPGMTTERLYQITEKFAELTSHLRLSDEQLERLQDVATRAFKTLGEGKDILVSFGKFVRAGGEATWRLIQSFTRLPKVSSALNSLKTRARQFANYFVKGFKSASGYFDGLTERLKNLKDEDFAKIPELLKTKFDEAYASASQFISAQLDKYPQVKEKLTGIWNTLKQFGSGANNKYLQPILNFVKAFAASDNKWQTIKDAFSGVTEKIQPLLDKLSELKDKAGEVAKNLDFSKAFAFLATGGILAGLLSLVDSFSKLASLASTIKTTFTNVNTILNAAKPNTFAKNVKAISEAILIMAVSLGLLSTIPRDRLWQSVGALTALAIVLTVMTAVFYALEAVLKKKELFSEVRNFAPAMLGLAVGVLILAKAAQMMGEVITEETTFARVGKILLALVGVAGILAAATIILNRYGGTFSMGAIMAILIAGAIYLLAAAIAKLSSLKFTDDSRDLMAFLGFLTILGLVSTFASKMNAVPDGFMKIAIGIAAAIAAFVVMEIAFEKLKDFEFTEVFDSLGKIAMIAGVVAVVGVVLTLAAKKMNNVGKAVLNISLGMLAIVACMFLIAQLVKVLAKMTEGQDLTGPIIAAAVIAIGLAILMVALGEVADRSDGGKGVIKIAAAMLLLTVAFGIMIGLFKVLQMVLKTMTAGEIIGVAFWLAVLGAMFAGLMYVAGLAGQMSGGKGVGLIIAAIAGIVTMVLMLMILNTFTWSEIWPGIVALLAIAGGLAAVMWGLSKLSQVTNNAIVAIVEMAVIIGAIVAITLAFKELEKMDPNKLMANVLLLVGAVAALGFVIYLLGSAIGNVKQVMLGVGILVGALLLISLAAYGFAAAMDLLDGVNIGGIASGLAQLAGPMAAVGLAGIVMIAGAVGIGLMAVVLALFGAAAIAASSGANRLNIALFALLDMVSAVARAFEGGFLSGLKNIGNELSTVGDKTVDYATKISKAFGKGMVPEIQNETPGIVDATTDVMSAMEEATVDGVDAVSSAAVEAVNAMTDDVATELETKGSDKVEKAADKTMAAASGIFDGLKNYLPEGMDMSNLGNMMFGGNFDPKAIFGNMEIPPEMQGMMDMFQNGTMDPSAMQNLMNGISNGVSEGMANVDMSGFIAQGQPTGEQFATEMNSGMDSVSFIDTVEKKLDEVIVAISNKFSDAKQAGQSLGEETDSGIAAVDATGTGEFFGLGFINGILKMFSGAYDAGFGLGDAAKTGAEAAGNVHSPSRVMYKIGEFYQQGFTNAIRDNVSKAWDTAFALGTAAVRALDESTQNGSTASIVPVLDMSQVYAEMDEFDGTWRPLIKPSLDMSDANPSFANMSAIVTGRQAAAATTAPTASSPATAVPTASVNFTQNNYSPKSLSRIEIYRQTKNLLATTNR